MAGPDLSSWDSLLASLNLPGSSGGGDFGTAGKINAASSADFLSAYGTGANTNYATVANLSAQAQQTSGANALSSAGLVQVGGQDVLNDSAFHGGTSAI